MATEGFKVEIVFSGGCLFVIRDSRWRPDDPAEVDVLLVDLVDPKPGDHGGDPPPKHFPILTHIATQNWDLGEGPAVSVGSRGERLHQHILVNCDIEFEPQGDAPASFDLKWAADSNSRGKRDEPRSSSASIDPSKLDCLEWVAPGDWTGMTDMGPIVPSAATARLRLPKGKLRSRSVVRKRNAHPYEPVLWDFKTGGTGKALFAQPLAEEVVYILEGLHEPELCVRLTYKDGSGQSFELNPQSADIIRLSITNLPADVGGPDPRHFPMYACLTLEPNPGAIAVPKQKPTEKKLHKNGICPVMIMHESSESSSV